MRKEIFELAQGQQIGTPASFILPMMSLASADDKVLRKVNLVLVQVMLDYCRSVYRYSLLSLDQYVYPQCESSMVE